MKWLCSNKTLFIRTSGTFLHVLKSLVITAESIPESSVYLCGLCALKWTQKNTGMCGRGLGAQRVFMGYLLIKKHNVPPLGQSGVDGGAQPPLQRKHYRDQWSYDRQLGHCQGFPLPTVLKIGSFLPLCWCVCVHACLPACRYM